MMMTFKRMISCMTVILAATLIPGTASATDVLVHLWDKGAAAMAKADTSKPMGMAMPGAGDMSKATMGITVDSNNIHAGEVTLVAINDSKDLVHEMLIAPIRSTYSPLPYNNVKKRVDEDAAHSLGEVSELDPGQTGALRITLKPGTYILLCNVPGHYAMGMWTTIVVKE
jgi:uncharacterized cupredoxin-like copper-binding protein